LEFDSAGLEDLSWWIEKGRKKPSGSTRSTGWFMKPKKTIFVSLPADIITEKTG
jgi:hypothetical protein